jgi:NAD+ kinase
MRPDIVLVYKKSQMSLILENRNTRLQSLVAADDVSVRPLQEAHEAHNRALLSVSETLKRAGCRVKRVYRARLKAEHCRGRLLVSVGGDGTLLDASHKIAGDDDVSAAVGVNSDTARSTGFLCAADATSFPALLEEILLKRLLPTEVRRLSGSVDDRPFPFPVLNDVLISHKNPAQTSKYLVERDGVVEDHKGSGVWVCTAAGSTAAMNSAGGAIQSLDDQRLHWRVREHFREPPSAGVVRPMWRLDDFFFDGDAEVRVTSKMREGRVWLDGPYTAVDLPMGARLVLHGRCPSLRLYATPAMAERRRSAQQDSLMRSAAGG